MIVEILFDADPNGALIYLSKHLARWTWKKPEGTSGTAEAFGLYGFGLEILYPSEDENQYRIYPVIADLTRQPDFAEVSMRWNPYGTLIRIMALDGQEKLAEAWAEEFIYHVERDDMLAEEGPIAPGEDAFLNKLSHRQREVIKRRLEGEPHKKIARDLKITPAQSRKYLSRGVKKLRESGADDLLKRLDM